MTNEAYPHLASGKLSFRDHLAIERTALANERTLLSYVRTMIGLAAVGGTLIKFFEDVLIVLSGWAFIIFGVAVLVIGFVRYIRMSIFIQRYEKAGAASVLEGDMLHLVLWHVLRKLHLVKVNA